MSERATEAFVPLRRRLGLPLLVLYGTGITVGAGIYVLIGAVAGHAGIYAPWSFVLAAVVMGLTVASYTELSTRFPVSAGEAAYVRAAFRSRAFSTTVGLLTVAIGVISSAAVTLGSAGYIQQFVGLPKSIIVIAVLAILGGVACWGILESVVLASIFTLIEVGGLVIVGEDANEQRLLHEASDDVFISTPGPEQGGERDIDCGECRREEGDFVTKQPKARVDIAGKCIQKSVNDAGTTHGINPALVLQRAASPEEHDRGSWAAPATVSGCLVEHRRKTRLAVLILGSAGDSPPKSDGTLEVLPPARR